MKKIILLLYLFTLLSLAQNPSQMIKPYFSQISGKYYKEGVDTHIIADINYASDSIEMQMYHLSNKFIVKALIEAHQRGIKVRVFTDNKKVKSQKYRALNRAGVHIRTDGNKNSLMANKILIIDGSIVWTGSANYTAQAFYRNHNNLLRISDRTIAKYYQDKFRDLYESSSSKSRAYLSKNKKIEIYFSPDSNIEKRIISLITSAKISVQFLAFSFTNPNIANALIEAHKRGIQVQGVFDKVQHHFQTSSQYRTLRKNHIKVNLNKNKFKLQSNIMIIDAHMIMTGSYTFTQEANSLNSENTIIMSDKTIAQKYISHFHWVYHAQ
ncbi:MAG: phospholipase D-like domain-containing protein [Sulfurovum sp.]|nr:phospholipase D-like domain-containing protein [Sulfurovum sp.]